MDGRGTVSIEASETVWMDLKLTFLGRVANRWRVRVDVPAGLAPRGLTVGLWGENDAPLGPAVVAPPGVAGVWEVEVAGPCPLPPGTLIRCVADIEESAPMVLWLGVDRRRGLHAFLHADGRLPVESSGVAAALGRREVERLAVAFPWIQPPPCQAPASNEVAQPAEEEEDTSLPPDVREMLRDDFGVDLDGDPFAD
jgi:hypothetical protein